jgi:cytochrome c biogenesis protein
MNRSSLLNKTWKLLCSLKLAIVLASAATLIIMGGSLLIPFNRRIFGRMDQLALGDWLATTGAAHPALSWWVFAAGALLLLLGLNTLCCFVDWARNLRTRWRKSGEYLIHLGFVLVLAAYV